MAAALATLVLGACGSARPGAPAAAQPVAEERADGWRPLFDGRTTAGWRGYRRADMPNGWKVVDGALTRVAEAGDIITTERFESFELALEWKIAPESNSGIFYRVSEAPLQMPMSGPEMQVVDDATLRRDDPDEALGATGAAMWLYPPSTSAAKPPGEWNAVRLVVRGQQVEHWLNGVRVAAYELGSPDWNARVSRSRFKADSLFGRVKRGHIGLQEHGGWIAYRHIRIKVLP